MNSAIVRTFTAIFHDCSIEAWPISDETWDVTRLTLFHEEITRCNFVLVIADEHLVQSRAWAELNELIANQLRADPSFERLFLNLHSLSSDRIRVPGRYTEWKPREKPRTAILSLPELDELNRYFQESRHRIMLRFAGQVPVPAPQRKHARELIMARSQLVVVRAIQLGWPLEEILSDHQIEISFLQCRWAAELMRFVEEGRIDLAIYNRERSLEAQRLSYGKLDVLANVGGSMRGRHLYLLGRNRTLLGCSEAEIVRQLRGKSLAAPLGSDIFSNLLIMLGIDHEWLNANNVRLIDMPADATVEQIRSASADFVTGGQNIRFEAVLTGDYVEAMNFLTASHLSSTLMHEKSLNCVIGNTTALAEVGRTLVASAIHLAWASFLQRLKNPSFIDSLSERIWNDVDRSISIETIRKIVHMSYVTGE